MYSYSTFILPINEIYTRNDKKIPKTFFFRDLGLAAQHLFSSMCFKLRKLRPCLVSSLQVDLIFKQLVFIL